MQKHTLRLRFEIDGLPRGSEINDDQFDAGRGKLRLKHSIVRHNSHHVDLGGFKIQK
jgi:hypothetical protein